MKTKTIAFSLLAGAFFAVASCGQEKKPDMEKPSAPAKSASAENTSAQAKSVQAGSVRSIELPYYQANLPAGPGRDIFAVACLSCHSARYITMQPPLSAAKWDESVRKMMKVYAAPISEEQVPQIVQYLMAAKEAGDTGAWDSLAVTPQAINVPADGYVFSDPSAKADTLKRGAALYAQNCASCHGIHGTGDGSAAATMLPRPTDLTTARYAPRALALTIRGGVRATAMPAAPALSDDDLRAVVLFTQQLAPAASAVPAIATSEVKAMYAKNCASCHGDTGAGDGFAAAALPRPPASFQVKQPSVARAKQIIADGIPGGAMPAWMTKLTEQQRQQLAEYVRSFYTETGLQ